MQSNKAQLLDRFHKLLRVAEELKATTITSTTNGRGPVAIVNMAMLEQWMDNSLDTILLAFGKDFSYFIKFNKHYRDFLNKTSSGTSVFKSCHPILRAAAEAYEANLTYDTKNPYLNRFDKLLEMAEEIEKTCKEEPGISGATQLSEMLEPIQIPGKPYKIVDAEMYGEWLNSVLDLIQATLKKESSYYISVEKYHNSSINNQYPSYELFKQSLASLNSARKAYEFNIQLRGNEAPELAKNANTGSKLKTNLPKIAKSIHQHFNKDEFKLLCFNVDVSFDDLGTENLELAAYELTARMLRNDRIEALIDCIVEKRPKLASLFDK